MKITLIRHGKVNMDWQKKYTAEGYSKAWDLYDECEIFPITEHLDLPEGTTVYATPFLRTQETARQFLGAEKIHIINELANEVPLKAYKSNIRPHSKKYLDFRGRVQWYTRSKRQDEVRRQTLRRAFNLIHYLESEGNDCALVTHGFYMKALIRTLRKQGYHIDRTRIFYVPNLCVVNAEKSDH